jgi:hypothetical protein
MSTENKKSREALAVMIFVILIALFLGPGMLWAGFWQYDEMVRFQNEGGTKKIHWFFALLYGWFGPTGVAVPFWAFGGLVTAAEVALAIWLVVGRLKKNRGTE